MRIKIRHFLIFSIIFLATTAVLWAQQGGITYIYDDLGRLVGVVDQAGNAASYTYDAVGNILSISRYNVSGPVSITLVSPNKGKVGTPVTIFGTGFSPNPVENQVSFSGVSAIVTASSLKSLSTSVPVGAATGPITVTAPLGSATSPEPFIVLVDVEISPTSVAIFPNGWQQFTSNTQVIWKVNGLIGGNATVGTISETGLYRAPATIPTPPDVTVTAANQHDPRLSASASVSIVPAPDRVSSLPVSVSLASPSGIVSPLLSPPLSLNMASLIPQVSPLLSPSVSVTLASPQPKANPLVSQLLSATFQPIITSITPNSGPQGATGLPITLTGAGFSQATGLNFLLNGIKDSNISASNLMVNPEGTQATALLSIAPNATIGPRVVQITTPGGQSSPLGMGGNIFSVIAP